MSVTKAASWGFGLMLGIFLFLVVGPILLLGGCAAGCLGIGHAVQQSQEAAKRTEQRREAERIAQANGGALALDDKPIPRKEPQEIQRPAPLPEKLADVPAMAPASGNRPITTSPAGSSPSASGLLA